MKKMIVLFFIIFLLFNFRNSFAPEKDVKEKQSDLIIENIKKFAIQIFREKAIQKLKHSCFSEKNLKDYLWLKKVKYKDIIFKQAILETGRFTSNVFKNGNNLFGMHLPEKRETTAIGYMIADNGAKVATYEHWTSSVDDYILWQQYNSKHLNGCYYAFLNEVNYAAGKNYTKKLRLI